MIDLLAAAIVAPIPPKEDHPTAGEICACTCTPCLAGRHGDCDGPGKARPDDARPRRRGRSS